MQIRRGEHWVISGPNGSGKTRLLELLSGAVHLQKGRINFDFIAGETWDDRFHDRKKKITYIPAHAIQEFIPNGQSLYYQQRYYAQGEGEERLVKDIIGYREEAFNNLQLPATLSIEPLLSLDVTRLSNGQLKKVLLVKSFLVSVPELLILDYPFEGLDGRSRDELCTFLDFVALSYKITIVLSDHHHHLPGVINRRLILREGKIVDQAVEQPQRSSTSIDNKALPEASGGESLVEINNLQIRYGEKIIIRDFYWTVRRGERWALIGRNGSGKTTLFSMIFADHPQAYAQNIYLFGRRRGTGESIWDIKKRISYLGPELITYLDPKTILLTAREYLKSLAREITEDGLQPLITFFEASEFFDRPVRYLSSGQLQLMYIIHCFTSNKELLLLDEPFQFIDDEVKQKVSEYLQKHLRAETTLILITHYEQDIADWTEHIMKI